VLPLTVLLFVGDGRAPVRQLAQLAMVLVTTQGLLGAYRVEYNAVAVRWLGDQPAGRVLAALHGSCAQVVFAALVALACAAWPRPGAPAALPARAWLRPWAVALPFLTYVQIVAGAAFRHTGQGFWFHAPLAYALIAGACGFVAVVLTDAGLRRRFGPVCWWLALAAFGQTILGNAAALLTGLLPPSERPIDNLQAFTTAAHHLLGSAFGGTIVAAAVALRTWPRR
jgi:hypothetical protein